MFGMQSLIFRLIGDSTAVENIYNGIILACIVTLIVSVWRVLFRNDEQVRRHAWLPVLMWYGLRIVWWSVPNNMLDTSLAMFCLASCYTQLLVLSKKRYANGYWILSGILVLLACLTKGPVGLFPLAFPVLYDLIFKNSRRRIFGGALTLLATVAILTFAVLQYPPARSLLKSYFDGQVMMALLKKREGGEKNWVAHFYLVKILIVNILPHIVFTGGIWFVIHFSKAGFKISETAKRAVLLNLLVIFSILVPMLASIKQSDPYLLPLTPFVALFFACLCVEWIVSLCRQFSFYPTFILSFASVICLIFMAFQVYRSAPDRMYEISTDLARHIPPGSKIYATPEIARSPEIQTPFQRYARLSVAFDPGATRYAYFDDCKTVPDSITRSPAFEVIPLACETALVIAR
ncbi:hypothetical protein [Dyadobacter sp. 676]|uniref:Glycosyltransferase RgtA/B/C/D-like domain-containing protein n=1 Tax=Dyadobacter sp. 676 TaxID=3088362 RepID=A0AAU8FGR4_9BACT